MSQSTNTEPREVVLRRYFKDPPSALGKVLGLIFLILGLVLAFSAAVAKNPETRGVAGGCAGVVFLPLGTVLLLRYWLAYRKSMPKLRDSEVDALFGDGIESLKRKSMEAMGLQNDELVSEPLAVSGPILWETHGVGHEDLVFRRGDDGKARFGVSRVTVLLFTENYLGAYSCDYNFIKNVPLNVATKEYHYRDVVSVSTGEESSNYSLPTGEKLTSVQEFKLSVASGESIRVAIGADRLRQITKAESMPETGAERAVAAIRRMLREKKA